MRRGIPLSHVRFMLKLRATFWSGRIRLKLRPWHVLWLVYSDSLVWFTFVTHPSRTSWTSRLSQRGTRCWPLALPASSGPSSREYNRLHPTSAHVHTSFRDPQVSHSSDLISAPQGTRRKHDNGRHLGAVIRVYIPGRPYCGAEPSCSTLISAGWSPLHKLQTHSSVQYEHDRRVSTTEADLRLRQLAIAEAKLLGTIACSRHAAYPQYGSILRVQVLHDIVFLLQVQSLVHIVPS